jgi:hypothetical protein
VTAGFAAVVPRVFLVTARGARVQLGLVVPALTPVIGRLAMVVRGRVMMERGIAVMVRGSTAETARLAGLARIPFVGVAALVGSATALAGDLALTIRIHPCKASVLVRCHDVSCSG